MATTLPNSGIVIPDAGNTNWYAMFVSLMTLLDTISAPNDYTVPASAQHVQASMAALFDDLYSRTYYLGNSSTYPVTEDGADVTADGVAVFERM